MIQLFAKTNDGRILFEPAIAEKGALRLNERVAQLGSEIELIWIDFEGSDEKELDTLRTQFKFHPLAVEDCMKFNQRPKVEDYEDHLFLVVHGLKFDQDRLDVHELHLFIQKHLVVTVHDQPIESVTALKKRFNRDSAAFPSQSDFLTHRVVDSVTDLSFTALECLEDQIDQLEEDLFESHESFHIEGIHLLQKQLTQARKSIAPQRQIMSAVVDGEYVWFSERSTMYFRDIYDHVVRLIESIEQFKERIATARDAYLALSTHRTNETVKRLTVISVVFLPLTFITGIFGMNFEAFPWANRYLFISVICTIAVFPAVMLIWLNKKRWL